jgi:peptide chain release factor 3
MDREARDSFELLDEIEQKLALDVTPASWPIGMGQSFLGCYDLFRQRLVLLDKKQRDTRSEGIECEGLDDPKLAELLPEDALLTLREEVEMASGLCPAFEHQSYLEGHMTPVFFGSALNNFGVAELLAGLARYAPSPRGRQATERAVEPQENKVSGFVFKIQANMDPKHRDRIAFVRLISGHFERGQKLTHVPSGSQLKVVNPLLFLAQDREVAEEAFAGDIIGIPNHGKLRVGDTLTEGEVLHFTGIPSFAPELIQAVRPIDPMKTKHLEKALVQLAEEGAASCFKARLGSTWLVGVVGSLQFDVLADRIRTEYSIEVRFESTELQTARWVFSDDQAELKSFENSNSSALADDHAGNLVFLARNTWHLERTEKDFPKLHFHKTREL